MSEFKLNSGEDPQRKLPLSAPAKPAQALTEKYRPKFLADIVGQGPIVFALEQFIEAPYSTAMVFGGDTGIGKTSAARAMANELGADPDRIGTGYDCIKSGTANKETILKALDDCRYSCMLGSRHHVVLVDEADLMTPDGRKIWLSALEDLPPYTLIIFATNNPEKFEQRFIDRCVGGVFTFESQAGPHLQDAQAYLDRIWQGEVGDGFPPAVSDLGGIVDKDGNLSYRRVAQALVPRIAEKQYLARVAMAQSVTQAEPITPRVEAIPTQPEIITGAPNVARPVMTQAEPTKRSDASAIDWEQVVIDFLGGESQKRIAARLGISHGCVFGRLKRMGVTRPDAALAVA